MPPTPPVDPALLENLTRQLPGVVYQYRLFPDGRSCFPFASAAIESIYEVTPDEVREDAAAVFARLHPADVPDVSASIAVSARDLTTWECEYRVVLPQRGTRWLRGLANPERLDDGGTLWHGFIRDVTESRQTQDELLRLKAAIEHSITGISIATPGGRILYANQATLDLWGFTSFRDEVEGRPATDFWADQDEVRAAVEQIVAHGTDTRVMTARRADGTLRRVQIHSSLIPGKDGRSLGSLASFLDITDAEAAASELRLRDQAMATSLNAIAISDPEGRFIYANPALARMWRFDSAAAVIGRHALELGEPVATAKMLETLARDGAWQGEIAARRHDGTSFVALVSANVVRDAGGGVRYLMGSAADITESKEMQSHLLQAQKMESVGRLAGGVAHDFNNLLTVMKGHLSFARTEVASGSSLEADLIEVERATDSAAALTQQLLAFSRRQVIAPRVLDLNALVDRMRAMLERVLGEEISLRVHCADDLAPVRFDPNQMEQLLINLVLNARDAMPGGGRLAIATSGREIDAEYAAAHPGLRAGPYVMLSVSDSGTGIAPEARAHIFEPFFTTKEAGRGTGLGLAMVYGAVKQNDGRIEVYSEPGEGTAFKILLPAVPTTDVPRSSPSVGIYPRGHESIVVVEDEPSIRLLAMRALEGQGYTVHVFESGQAALDALRDGSITVDLVISDVIMPEMNGAVLAEHLRLWRPGIRILFVSGYPEDAVAHHGVLDEHVDFLSKPYSVGTLALRVRDAIDRKTTDRAPQG